MSSIVDAHIIEETPNRLADGGRSFKEFIANGLDKLSKGKKAGPISEGLIFADVVKDPAEMRLIVKNNGTVLNKYFDTIDYEKLIGSGEAEPIKTRFIDRLKSHAPTLLFGVSLGIAGSAITAGFKKGAKK
jgi:hypothetical protein